MTRTRFRQHCAWSLALLITLIVGTAAGCRGADPPDAPTATPTVSEGGLTTTTPTPTPTLDPGLQGEDREVAIWGQRVCELARTFAVDFLASGDPRNPEELSLEERKERADSIFPAQFAAVDAALDGLGVIAPPERTVALHDLLRQTYEGLREALRDQEVIIEAADDTEEIAFSNMTVNEWISLAFRQAELLQNAGYCP
ncbi:MAG: hypothetical protein OXH97_00875 [Chloroflexota bacterium]|nr:hypothetical protein [Chloroflexota bacterium]